MDAHFYAGLTVETDASTQYATIYDPFGNPAGTLYRRRVYDAAGFAWRIFDLTGVERGRGTFIRTALREFVRWRWLDEAKRIVAAAERDLGGLTDGQRRDLVKDRMPITDVLARELVELMGARA